MKTDQKIQILLDYQDHSLKTIAQLRAENEKLIDILRKVIFERDILKEKLKQYESIHCENS